MLIENEFKKLEIFDAAYFRGKNYFEEYGTQNYLVFQGVYKYFERIAGIGNSDYISSWKSKRSSGEKINSVTTSDYTITPKLDHYGSKTRVEFSGSCLKQEEATYSYETIVNIYIVYEISKTYNISSYPTSEKSLFGAVSLTKHSDIDQYKYPDYGIGFDRKGEFSFGSRGSGRNVIMFGTDMSSSVHANNKTRNILVLGKYFIQGIDGTTIYAEKMYSINFTENNKKFCLSLHYNKDNRYLFVNS